MPIGNWSECCFRDLRQHRLLHGDDRGTAASGGVDECHLPDVVPRLTCRDLASIYTDGNLASKDEVDIIVGHILFNELIVGWHRFDLNEFGDRNKLLSETLFVLNDVLPSHGFNKTCLAMPTLKSFDHRSTVEKL